MLHAQQHAEHVGIEGGGVTVRRLFGHRAGLAFGAGIIDGDVEAAEPRDGLLDQVLHLVLMADIGANEFRFRAKRAKLGGQRLGGVIAAAGDEDASAFVREGEGGGAADGGQGAGNEDNGITHVTSPLSAADMPVKPCLKFRYGVAVSPDWYISAAVAGDVDRAGAQEKDFVRSKPYF